jgi:hypothetical protein
MQTNTNLRVVENNSHSSKDFTIQASGKMFHMVISGLYSNKPQSITREIWSNAFDAHAMVDKQDVPFEVSFPTSLTPVFSCRDFGAGIAHENMEGFYTVLGHSTKEGTNKAVGKWGVGRMSPMSYTDTFSVVSRHKGMVAYYSIQLGPDGSPQLHVLAEPMPTNEPDGLEVSFPVKRDDIASFQRAAEVVSYGFKVPPKVKNSQDKQFQPITKSLSGDGYYFYNDSRLSGPYAQMGCVLYPISGVVLNAGLLPSNNRNIVYEFDIGDLEVTASREALSYGPNDPTLKSLEKKLKLTKSGMVAEAQKEIDTQPSMYRAMKLVIKYSRLLGDTNFHWKGQPILFQTRSTVLNYPYMTLHVGSKGWNSKTIGFGLEKEAYAGQDYTIYVQDLNDRKANARAATRIAAALKSNERYIWVKTEMNLRDSKASLDKMIHDLDYPVVYVKDLPDDGPIKTAPRGKLTVSTLNRDRRIDLDLSSEDFDNGGYYYHMEGGDYPKTLMELRTLIEQQLGMPIILVPKPMWRKFDVATQWKLLLPKVDAMIKQYAAAAQIVLGDQYGCYPFTKLRGMGSCKGPLGQFSRQIETPNATQFMGVDSSVWNKQFQRLGLPVINSDRIVKEYNIILDKYPLLKLYDGSDKIKHHFLHYVNLIDNA